MKKNKKNGNLSIGIVMVIFISSVILGISSVRVKRQNDKKNLNISKTLIYEIYKKYATLAFDQNKEYNIIFDYDLKQIEILDASKKIIEKIELPKTIEYATVYGDKVLKRIENKITINGNITPIYSIYIFGKDKVAKYRVSLYGFDTLKYLRINLYKNINDKKATYKDIVNFHSKFSTELDKSWVKE